MSTVVENVIGKSKYNAKINAEKIFIPGTSILESCQKKDFSHELLPSGRTEAARRRNKKSNVTNEVITLLDEKFSKVDHVPRLKTTLYPHQQTVVKAMLDLEYGRSFNMGNKIMGSLFRISYNAAVLSEPVGSGKTIDILSVITLSKIPRAIPDIMELAYPKLGQSVGYVRRKFRQFLKPTIIFVGSSVMKQWENAIKVFTDLKSFSVNSIIELKVLLEMISNRNVNDYDIILAKNGKITRSITLPDGIELEDKNKVAQAYIYNVIANLRQYCWARVVIDDFDSIKLPHNAGIVNGIFTWYISSTRKKMETRHSNTNKGQTASELLKSFDYGCAGIMYNHILFNILNVRNDIDFLKATTNIPNPKYHIAIFKNPNNKYISLLGSMGDDEINRITEMLNGDAIGAAAEAAGIKSGSVANIFEKILGDKFTKYRFSGDLLAFIEHLHEEEEQRRPMSENPDEEDRYGKKDLLEFREVEYKYPGVNTIIDNTEEEYKEVKKSTGIAIQRVKDNIKHGSCPVCKSDLTDCDETIIVKCCGTVFCGKCGISAQALDERYNKLQNGTCSNCRKTLSIKDLIYIGDSFDLDKIEKEEFDEETEVNPELKAQSKATLKPRTKYTAITDIIKGIAIPEAKRVDMYIPNMMKGGAYLKEPAIRKVLIFANHDETLKLVTKELDEEKIHYWRLMGGIGDINQTALAFTNCKTTCALVINSTRHCSGLNLQTSTDLVFTHSIIDPAIESQVAGRGHRLGRTTPLNIWFMQYDNEYETLAASHGIRTLTAEELEEERKFTDGDSAVAINTVTDNTTACYLDKSAPKEKHQRTEHNAPDSEDDLDDLDDDLDDADDTNYADKRKKKFSKNKPKKTPYGEVDRRVDDESD